MSAANKPKERLIEADRHKRFVDMAREVGASDDAKASGIVLCASHISCGPAYSASSFRSWKDRARAVVTPAGKRHLRARGRKGIDNNRTG